ncbi:MAG: 30S ribosomal protein S24e [archaeon]
MEIKILNKHENPLMNRTEITAEILHQSEPTPKRNDVRKLLAAQLGHEEKLVVIKKIGTEFGMKSKLTANVYHDSGHMEKIEPKYIIGREKGQKLKPGKKEEAKKEEKK